jgi:hypothetical protein
MSDLPSDVAGKLLALVVITDEKHPTYSNREIRTRKTCRKTCNRRFWGRNASFEHSSNKQQLPFFKSHISPALSKTSPEYFAQKIAAISLYGSSPLSGSSASNNPERASVKRAAPCVVSSRTGALTSRASSAATKRRKNSKAAALGRVVPCSAIDNFRR